MSGRAKNYCNPPSNVNVILAYFGTLLGSDFN
jgi:hypothetical protein